MSDVDLFADIEAETTQETSETEAETSAEESTTDNETPVEVVAEIPAGAIGVTEFAAMMTQQLIKDKVLSGGDLDPSTDYVVPQQVYQTVKAVRDRIPHVLVKDSGDREPRAYILVDEATKWWLARRERLANRGSGTKSASSRTPDDNLALLGNAVEKVLYATSRLELWKTNLESAEKLVTKYRGFLKDANVAEETVDMAIQEATDRFQAEMAAKASEKEARKAEKAAAKTAA